MNGSLIALQGRSFARLPYAPQTQAKKRHLEELPWGYRGHTEVLPWGYRGHTEVLPWGQRASR